MSQHHPKSDSYGYEKLIDEESNSTRQNPQHFEQISSAIHQRTSIKATDIPNSSSSALSEANGEILTQDKPQQKGMKSCFGTCYKVWMFIQILFSGSWLFGTFCHMITNQELDKFEFMIMICSLVQSIFAFSGARKENSEKMQKALMLMHISLVMIILSLGKAFDDYKGSQKVKTRSGDLEIPFYAPALFSPIWGIGTLLLFTTLPTIKARNRIRLSSPKNENCEVALNEDTSDPVEELSSWKYIVYKYWVLIAFYWTLKDIGSVVYRYLFEMSKVLEEMKSDPAYLLTQLIWWFVSILFLVFLFLVFEGIRRKNLEKTLRAIKLMKIAYALDFIKIIWNSIQIDFNTSLEKHLKNNPEQLDLVRKIGPIGFPLIVLVGHLIVFYFLYIYGARKVREVLKAHQKANYKL